MRSLKAKLKKPSASNETKDDWSKLDQRVWHSVTVNHPVKLASKFTKYPNIDVNKLCPSAGYSVVHYAAAKGLDDCLNVLLAHSANSSNRDVTGATPLHASARYGHKGTTSKLLATCSVDVNARDDNQCTALHFASFEGHLDCVQLIANRKECNIHCIDKDGRTPLMVAAAMGRSQVCEDLIKRGADVNHHDLSSLQHSALTLAAEAGHAEVVKLLCDNGANYNAKLTDGRTALDVARSRSRRAVVDALHVIQLTQAAKKVDQGDALDHDVNKSKHLKKREKHSNDNDVKFTTPEKIVIQATGSIKPDNQRLSSHDPDKKNSQKAVDHESPVAALPLYVAPKQGHLYDRDVSLYDSKSTLASVSSLDASTIIDTHKSPHNDATPSSHSRGLEQGAKLSEELTQKQDRINDLEKSYRDLLSTSKMEIESLKKSNNKYEQSVQELEKDNDRLAKECLSFQRERAEHSQRMETLQKSYNDLQASSHENSMLKKRIKSLVDEIDTLAKEKTQLKDVCKIEETKYEALLSQLKDLFLVSGVPLTTEDYVESLRVLKSELLRKKENNAKKSEQQKKLNQQVEHLQGSAVQQENVIKKLNVELLQLRENVKAMQQDNSFLSETKNTLQKQLQDAEISDEKHRKAIDQLEHEVADLKQQQLVEKQSYHDRRALEKEVELSASIARKSLEEHNSERLLWEEAKSTMQKKIDELLLKCDASKHEALEYEKQVGKLRVERNQREAFISKLEKDMKAVESRRKEVEVEGNRTRQLLTESKQRCSDLQSEIVKLQEAKKDLIKKLQAAQLCESNQVERNKIDCVKTNLDNLVEQIEKSEKSYNDTLLAYRGHLLLAAKGELNPEVLGPLKEILRLVEKKDSCR